MARIVRIADMSDEEKEKWQEQVQTRETKRQTSRQNEIERVNKLFENNTLPVAEDGYISKNQKDNKNIWNDIKGIASNFTRSLGNLGINAYENVNRINGEYINNRNNIIENTNNKYITKVLEDKGYNEEQIQRLKNNAPTLKSIANESKILNGITENANKVVQPMENKFQEWESINNQKIQENTENASNPVSKKILELTPSIAQSSVNLIPGGNILFSAGITQDYYERAKNEKGMSDEEASKYASIMSTLESASEIVGAGLTKNIGKSLIKGNVKSALANYGLDIGENFLEEAVMEPLGELTTTAVAGKEKANWENIEQRSLQAGIDGAITSILMGGASVGVGSAVNVVNKMSKGQTVTQTEIQRAVKDTQNSGAVDIENIVKNEINNTSNLQQNQANNINTLPTQQTIGQENNIAQNGMSEQINIANNQETLYNNNESESDINEGIYSRTIGRDGRIKNEIANQRGQTEDTGISQRNISEEFKQNKQRSYEEFVEYANKNKIELDTVETKRLRKIANDLGVNAILFNGDGNSDYIGMTDKQNPNNVYIDMNQKEIRGEDMLYHEFLHSRKKSNDSVYIDKIAPIEQDIVENYTDIINNFINEKGLDERYKNYPELIAEEIIADYTSKHIGKLEIDYDLPQFYIEAINQAVDEMANNIKINNIQQAPSVENNAAETSNRWIEQKNKEITEKQIAEVLTESPEKVKESDRKLAIIKANILDKGIVFEELSRKADKLDRKLGNKADNRDLQGKWDYTLTSMARAQDAIGKTRYEFDSTTKTQKQISKSLEDIRSEVGNNTSEFQNYMYHQLNIDRMTLEDRFGGDTGTNYERTNVVKNKPVFSNEITAEISKQKVAEYEQKYPKFKEWAKDVYDYNNANKKELVRTGVISQELADKLDEMYPHYVPIKRVDTRGNAINVPLDTNRTGINAPIKKATGGTSDILPLFETMADRTLQTYRASARNSFGVELKNTLQKLNQYQQTDMQQANVDTIIEEIGEQESTEQLLQEGKNGNNPTFTVFENGEKVTFDITKDMYDALKPLSDSSILNKTFKPLNIIGNVRRGVLTEYNPLFLITNGMKDSQDVLLNSQHATKTYMKFPEAYSQIITKGYWYNEYVANGGEQNSYFKDGKFESDKKVNVAKKALTIPLNTISNVNGVIEMAPRLAEYIASREAGRSIETSMLDASRVTTNFKAGGDVTKFANRNGATFLNAGVQGAMQVVRNVQEANVKGLKGWAVLAGKTIIAGLPAIILNNLVWKDDEDYEELQDYVKDNYYCVAKIGEGKFIRIPKGRVTATIQKIVGNINEYITDDKELNIDNFAKDFWEDINFTKDNVAPNNPLDNNILSPIIQVITNKSWYGEDIVPSRLQNKPKVEQYDETTDSLSIWLGQKLNQSPYKINYLLDQYGGGISDIALPMMTKQAENNVVEDKFTTDSTMKSRYPGEFFENLEKLEIKANSEKATDEDILKYKYASEVSSGMSDLYKEKRQIQNSDATDKEKKEKLKKVQEKINKLAKNGMSDSSNIKINNNIATVGEQEYYKKTDLKTQEKEWNKLTDEEKNKNKNITLKTYADYKEKVSLETIKQRKNRDIKEDASIKTKDKINILINSSYDMKQKQAIYENYIKNSDDKKYDVIKVSGLNINSYLKYKLAESNGEFKADRKDDGTEDGKSIYGSAKNKEYNYIKSMQGVTGTQKAILFGLYNTPNKSDKQLIVNYIMALPGKKTSEKKEMLKQFSWITFYKDGTFNY